MIRSSAATARRRRKDLTYAAEIKRQVFLRDAFFCRAAAQGVGICAGVDTWAHLTPRSKTRRMAPEARHSTQNTLVLCLRHHQQFDAHALTIEPLTPDGANGPLRFTKTEAK